MDRRTLFKSIASLPFFAPLAKIAEPPAEFAVVVTPPVRRDYLQGFTILLITEDDRVLFRQKLDGVYSSSPGFFRVKNDEVHMGHVMLDEAVFIWLETPLGTRHRISSCPVLTDGSSLILQWKKEEPIYSM